MPSIIPQYDALTGPAVVIPNVDRFDWDAQGYLPNATPAAPLADGAAVTTFKEPTLPTIGRNPAYVPVMGNTAQYDTRTVDPGYGMWSRRQPFMAQGFYDHVPDGVNAPVTGNGTPNVHATYLRAGVQTNLAQYTPDQYTYSAAYVGALTPQTIPVGYGGIQA